MKLHYYAETDSLYIELRGGAGAEVREISEGVNADLDSEGHVIGFDIDRASKLLDLSTLETFALPITTSKAA